MIKLEEINQNDFQIQERTLNGEKVFLITPSFIKHTWQEDELHLRSIMVDKNGVIISSGFPKFRNYMEHPPSDLLVDDAIKNGRAVFPEKMDGSLLIRSVINGSVHFRTRGSHILLEPYDSVMELIRSKYPKLLDPNLDCRYSILFEYTGPENQIVIKYDQPQLTVLGLMDLSAFPPEFVSSPELVKDLELTYGTPAVKFHKLEGSLQEITNTIKGWKNIEGIVVWATLENGQMLLVKIKATEYIKIHSLKFKMSSDRLFQYCFIKDINSLEQLKDSLFNLGVDWEGVSFLSTFFENYMDKKNETLKQVSDLISEINNRNLKNLSRKDAVLSLNELAKDNLTLFNVGINYLFKDGVDINRYIGAMILGVSINQLNNISNNVLDFPIKENL